MFDQTIELKAVKRLGLVEVQHTDGKNWFRIQQLCNIMIDPHQSTRL